MLRLVPPPVTVTVPDLCLPGLASASILNEPLPVRLAGVMFEILNHCTLLVGTFQVVFDVTFMMVLLAAGSRFHTGGETVSVSPAAWLTATVRMIPPAVTVIVPDLCAPGLASAVIVNEPLPLRFAGVMFEILNHCTLLAGTLHVVFDVTLMVVLLAPAPGFHEVGESVSAGAAAAWLTATVRVIPPAVTVIVPDLCPPGLASASILNEPLPVRFAGVMFEIVSHDTLLVGTLQVVLDVTFMVMLFASAPGFHEVGESVSAGAAA